MSRFFLLIVELGLGLGLLLFDCVVGLGAAQKRPNIVILMADDLGYGDVGFLGNGTIKTPNIDRIAREGAILSHHLAASALCTPSRAAFLTARYPIRYGMVSDNRVGMFLFVANSGGLPPSETTFATALKQIGYTTGLIGKWHLGVSCATKDDFCHHPLNHGFDYFYGVPLTIMSDFIEGHGSVAFRQDPFLATALKVSIVVIAVSSFLLLYNKLLHPGVVFVVFSILVTCAMVLLFSFTHLKLLNSCIMRNFDYVEQPIRFENMSKRLVMEGEEFLERSSGGGQPFLLYMSFLQVHTPLHTGAEFAGHSRHSRYGDNIEELDWCVGQILGTLERLGVADNTLVYFVSDNGGHVELEGADGQREGGHNGVFRGGKAQGGMDGGIRVPAAIRWPGVITPGTRVRQVTSMMDFYPTLADALGLEMPGDGRVIDGRSMLPLLTSGHGQSPRPQPQPRILYHYCDTNVHAARLEVPSPGSDEVYKVHYATPPWVPGTQGCGFGCFCQLATWHNPPLIYEITGDPAEERPLAADYAHPHVVSALRRINDGLEAHRRTVTPSPSQFSIQNLLWKPWLQPCCNFPMCDCIDEKYEWLTQGE